MKRPRTLVSVGILGVASLSAVYCWRPDIEAVDHDGFRPTARVEYQTLDQATLATGVIRPVVGAQIDVGSRISGTVVDLPVAVGDLVEIGEVLAELDATALRAEVDLARAEVALAVPQLALATSTLGRRQELATTGLLSQEELEIATLEVEMAKARLDASRARLSTAQTTLGYCLIRAPIRGVIAEVRTRRGETVAAGLSAPTFVTILDLDRLEVLAYVDETDIGRISVGQTAVFTVDTYPDTEIEARVVAIQPRGELQGAVVNYVARLQFEPPEALRLRPEMTAHLRLLTAARERKLVIPRQAIEHRDSRQYVRVEREGRWLEQEVTTGWRSETAVEVASGLSAGEVVELRSRAHQL